MATPAPTEIDVPEENVHPFVLQIETVTTKKSVLVDFDTFIGNYTANVGGTFYISLFDEKDVIDYHLFYLIDDTLSDIKIEKYTKDIGDEIFRTANGASMKGYIEKDGDYFFHVLIDNVAKTLERTFTLQYFLKGIATDNVILHNSSLVESLPENQLVDFPLRRFATSTMMVVTLYNDNLEKGVPQSLYNMIDADNYQEIKVNLTEENLHNYYQELAPFSDGTKVTGKHDTNDVVAVVYYPEEGEYYLHIKITESDSIKMLRAYVNPTIEQITHDIIPLDISFDKKLEEYKVEMKGDVPELKKFDFHVNFIEHLKKNPVPTFSMTFYKEAEPLIWFKTLWFPEVGYINFEYRNRPNVDYQGTMNIGKLLLLGVKETTSGPRLQTSIQMKYDTIENQLYSNIIAFFSARMIFPKIEITTSYAIQLRNVKKVKGEITGSQYLREVEFNEFFGLYEEKTYPGEIYLSLFLGVEKKPFLFFFHDAKKEYFRSTTLTTKHDASGLSLIPKKIGDVDLFYLLGTSGKIDIVYNADEDNVNPLNMFYELPPYYESLIYPFQSNESFIINAEPSKIAEYNQYVKKFIKYDPEVVSFRELIGRFIDYVDEVGKAPPFVITFATVTITGFGTGKVETIPKLWFEHYYTPLEKTAKLATGDTIQIQDFKVTGVSEVGGKKVVVVNVEIDGDGFIRSSTDIKIEHTGTTISLTETTFEEVRILFANDIKLTYEMTENQLRNEAKKAGVEFNLSSEIDIINVLLATEKLVKGESKIGFLSIYKNFEFHPHLWVRELDEGDEFKNAHVYPLNISPIEKGKFIALPGENWGTIEGFDDINEIFVQLTTSGIPYIAIKESKKGIVMKYGSDISNPLGETGALSTFYYMRKPETITKITVLPRENSILKYLELINITGIIPHIYGIGLEKNSFRPNVLFKSEVGENEFYQVGGLTIKKPQTIVPRSVEDVASKKIVIFDVNYTDGPKIIFSKKQNVIYYIQLEGEEELATEGISVKKEISEAIEAFRISAGEYGKNIEALKVDNVVKETIKFVVMAINGLDETAYSKHEGQITGLTLDPVEGISISVEYDEVATSLIRIWSGSEDLKDDVSTSLVIGMFLRNYYIAEQRRSSGSYKPVTTPIFLPYLAYTARRHYIIKMTMLELNIYNSIESQIADINMQISLVSKKLPKIENPYPVTTETFGTFGPYVLVLYSIDPEVVTSNEIKDVIEKTLKGVKNRSAYVPVLGQWDPKDGSLYESFSTLGARVLYNPEFRELLTNGLVNLNSSISIHLAQRMTK